MNTELQPVTLLEPRLKPLFDIYVEAAALNERAREAVVLPLPPDAPRGTLHESNAAVNTADYARLLLGLAYLSQGAAHLLTGAMRLREIGQVEGYERFCEAAAKWGQPS